MSAEIVIEGLDEAIDDINFAVNQIADVSQAALLEASFGVMNSAQKRLKPSVISGNLRASGYVRSSKTSRRPDEQHLDTSKSEPIPTDSIPPIGVELGFTAQYALYAHENMEGRAPKFLENAISENKDRIISIIKERSARAAESRN